MKSSGGSWKHCLEIPKAQSLCWRVLRFLAFRNQTSRPVINFERKSPCASWTSHPPSPTNCTFNCSAIEDAATSDQEGVKTHFTNKSYGNLFQMKKQQMTRIILYWDKLSLPQIFMWDVSSNYSAYLTTNVKLCLWYCQIPKPVILCLSGNCLAVIQNKIKHKYHIKNAFSFPLKKLENISDNTLWSRCGYECFLGLTNPLIPTLSQKLRSPITKT